MVAATWGLGLLRTLQCLVRPAHLESSLVFAAAEVPVIISAVWLITRRSAAPASSCPVATTAELSAAPPVEREPPYAR